MISLSEAKKIMKDIPSKYILNFPHDGKKLALEYSFEDDDYYIFDIFAIPQNEDLGNLTDSQKDAYFVLTWRVNKENGLAEEWME